MTKWRIWTYDIWGNPRDGYEVNDRSEVTDSDQEPPRLAEMPDEPSDADVLRTLKAWGVLRQTTRLSQVEVDGDDMVISIDAAKDGYPLAGMERVDGLNA